MTGDFSQEIEERWQQVLGACTEFGFATHSSEPEQRERGSVGTFFTVQLLLSDEDDSNFLDSKDRLRLLYRHLADISEEQLLEPYGIFFTRIGVNGEHPVYPGSKAAFIEGLWKSTHMAQGLIQVRWSETLQAPVMEARAGKPSRTIIYPDGSTIDDAWRHEIRQEFKKIYQKFGVSYLRAPTFTGADLSRADLGGDFQVRYEHHDDILTPADRLNLLVSAIAKKLVELVDRGFHVSPETILQKPITKDNPISVAEMIARLRPRFTTDRKSNQGVELFWTVFSPRHTTPKDRQP